MIFGTPREHFLPSTPHLLTRYGHVKTAEQLLIGTLAVDGWTVTFSTARRGWVGPYPAQAHPRCTKCNSPPINGQCTNFILVDVAI